MTETASNPVVARVPLDGVQGCNGWTLRIYADGMADAVHADGLGLTAGVNSRSKTWQEDLVALIAQIQDGLSGRIVRIDYVDPGAQGEYGFFGKRVASSDVRGMSRAERDIERQEMLDLLGSHVVAVEVEEIPAARR